MAESDDALVRAIKDQDVDGVRAALAAGADPGRRVQPQGGSVLALAAATGDAGIVGLLLAAGADPDDPGDGGAGGYLLDPPLYCAAVSGSADAVRLLLAAGADPTIPGPDRPVVAAASSVEALRALLEAGADPDPPVTGPAWFDADSVPDDGDGFNLVAPVGYEIAGNPDVPTDERVQMLRVLVDHGGRLSGPEGSGGALEFAARSADPEAVALLLDAGADPRATPGLVAAACWGPGGTPGSAAVIDLLVAAGGDVEVANEHGHRPLQLALQPYDEDLGTDVSAGFQPDAAIALLRHGASIDITVPDGRRPLHVAVAEREPEVVAALLAAGADPTEPDASGRSALVLAADLVDDAERTVATSGTSSAEESARYWADLHLPAARRCLALLTEAAPR
ncbi:MAG: ankyrin repeat domain-containing protein [Acidimicrobiales bacterium]